MPSETNFVIELLLDEATLTPEQRTWLLARRGTWLTVTDRRTLSELHEKLAPWNRKRAS